MGCQAIFDEFVKSSQNNATDNETEIAQRGDQKSDEQVMPVKLNFKLGGIFLIKNQKNVATE